MDMKYFKKRTYLGRKWIIIEGSSLISFAFQAVNSSFFLDKVLEQNSFSKVANSVYKSV